MVCILRKIVQVLCPGLFVLLFPSFALTQEATVIRNVNLRSDPSTANPSIRLPNPPEALTLIGAGMTNGYYDVGKRPDIKPLKGLGI